MGVNMRKMHSRLLSGLGRFYEELPLGPKIMVTHPASIWCPPTDVFECYGVFVIRCALSGLKKREDGRIENAEVLVEDNMIVIRGERLDECPHQKCSFIQMEVYYGPFECRVEFAAPFDHEGIRAEYRDGFLEVVVPKAPKQKSDSHRINVKS